MWDTVRDKRGAYNSGSSRQRERWVKWARDARDEVRLGLKFKHDLQRCAARRKCGPAATVRAISPTMPLISWSGARRLYWAGKDGIALAGCGDTRWVATFSWQIYPDVHPSVWTRGKYQARAERQRQHPFSPSPLSKRQPGQRQAAIASSPHSLPFSPVSRCPGVAAFKQAGKDRPPSSPPSSDSPASGDHGAIIAWSHHYHISRKSLIRQQSWGPPSLVSLPAWRLLLKRSRLQYAS